MVDPISQFLDLVPLKPGAYSVSEGELIILGNGFSEHFPLKNIRSVLAKCRRLEAFDGFEKLIEGFANPQQFGSTVFEIDSAIFCLANYPVSELEFSPSVLVGRKKKYPEFSMKLEDHADILVECKSMASLNRAKSSRVARLIKLVKPRALGIIPENRRLEVGFRGLPSHWNRNLVDQIFGAAGELVRRDFIQKGVTIRYKTGPAISLKLCRISDPLHFKGRLRAGDVGPNGNPKLLVSELSSLKQGNRALINDAFSQLPADKSHMIFVYSIDHDSCLAATKDIFATQGRDHLLAVHSWAKDVRIFWNPTASDATVTYLRKQMT